MKTIHDYLIQKYKELSEEYQETKLLLESWLSEDFNLELEVTYEFKYNE